MNMQELIDKGWADHAEDAEGVAARLPGGLELAETTADLANLAGLVVHVYGEHLGRWRDGVALLEKMVALPAFAADHPAGKSVFRSMAVLELCDGKTSRVAELEELGRSDGAAPAESDRVRIRAIAASALAGQKRTADAITTFESAMALAAYGPTADDPAARALAITGNNLACELEVKSDRSPAEVDLMKLAARTGRTYWEVAGNWENVAWAEFRLAMTMLQAAEPTAAIDHARACLELFDDNEAPAYHRFFANHAVARSLHTAGQPGASEARDAAAAIVDEVDEDSREECRTALGKLEALLAASS